MKIYYITSNSEKTLDMFARDFSESPELVWLEPRPTLINGQIGLKEVGLKNAFQGLQQSLKKAPWFEIPKGVFIEEARFYWQHGMLHLLAQESELGYRYFGCSENKSFLNRLGLSTAKSKEVDVHTGKNPVSKIKGVLNRLKLGKEKSKEVDVHTGKNPVSKIFLRQDLERFNLEDTLKIDKVQVVSYWDEDSLWAWRLMPVN